MKTVGVVMKSCALWRHRLGFTANGRLVGRLGGDLFLERFQEDASLSGSFITLVHD